MERNRQNHREYVVDLFKVSFRKVKIRRNEGTADFVVDINVLQNGIQKGKYNIIPLTYPNEKLSEYINKLISSANSPFATKSSRPIR